MRIFSVSLMALVLVACGNTPPQPAWRADAFGALNNFSDAYLKGDTSIADAEFKRARADTASTGRPALVAHAELFRCATRVAALEYDHCPGFAALAQDADESERAYAAYLDGRWQGLNAALLPEQHRAVVGGSAKLAAIADPLSRLVAAGALFQVGKIAPDDISVAIDTASAQGWRRPLLMWLGVAQQRAQAAGDAGEVARLQRRIDLVAP